MLARTLEARTPFDLAGESDVKTLLSEPELRAGVARLAAEIERDFRGRPLTILGVMTGSVVLLADLIRQLDLPLRVGVLQASSYRGEMTRGTLIVNSELMPDISNRDVLLVDDIFDTGHTLRVLFERLGAMGARSVRTVVLLFKEGRQEVAYKPDYVGFTIPDLFVVGYGLDFRDEYRHLPFVAALEPGDLEPGDLTPDNLESRDFESGQSLSPGGTADAAESSQPVESPPPSATAESRA